MASKKSRKKAMLQKKQQAEVKNEPITNPELVAALELLKTKKTPENEQDMLQKVHQAKLLCPVMFDTPLEQDATNGAIHMKDTTKLKFILVNTQEGKSFFPAFTDMNEAQKLPNQGEQKPAYIVRTLKDYRKMLRDPNGNVDGVVINPMNHNIVFPKEYLLNPPTPQQANANQAPVNPLENQQITYYEPSIYPTALVNKVFETCKELEGVSRVWFKGARAGMANGYAFFVEADSNTKEILAKIQEAAQEQAGEVPILVQEWSKQVEENILHDDFPLFDKELDV